ncbi:oxidoreductase NAD-binding domain-containing protein [Phthorimaea operculella]|nr:oxidoreductase NAD-binding domain-containing protein [Phthorimaea operculella]
MKQPCEPNQEDCCNSGCNPCIFDVYEQQLKKYEKFLETGQLSDEQTENAINQLEYTKFTLVKVMLVCEAHLQLFFRRQTSSDGKKVLWKAGDHFLLKYNNGDQSCTRAYTPILSKKQINDYDFFILVRVYENGLVTNYLKHLQVGNETLWRGPYGSYNYKANTFSRLVMVAQGTGIAPFISIIESVLGNEDDMTKIVLYYCAKNEDLILLRDEMYAYREYWNFSYKIFLSQGLDKSMKYQEPLIRHRLEPEDFDLLKPFHSSDQVLLCGSSEFMKHFEKLLNNEDYSAGNIVLF